MKPITTDEVLDLLDAHSTTAALGAAMELGLFWLLEEEPVTADEVARSLGVPGNRCRYWLQLLSDAGLLEQVSGRYAPSETTRTTILQAFRQESWALLAEEARRQLPGLQDLPLHLHEPGSVWTALGLKPPVYYAEFAENLESARRFTRMLYDLHRPLADELARTLDLSAVHRLMDLGGGSGVVSMALLRRYPELSAVVVDLANVCAAGREIVAEGSLKDRLRYHPADFLQDPLPTGFDMVLQCDIDVYDERLFAKVWDALNPGGRFVVVDQLAPTEDLAPPSRVHWAFEGSLRNPEFSYLTAAQLQAGLEKAGFSGLSERALRPIGGPSTRFMRGMILIEAHKEA